MLGDRWDVGGNLAQARQGQLERGQAIEQVLSETLGRHILPPEIVLVDWEQVEGGPTANGKHRENGKAKDGRTLFE